MWLLVGLGNPGRRYEGTRHNIGFEVVDELHSRHMQGGYRSKFGSEACTGLIGRENVLILKPMEFMNKSGYAVQRAAQFHDVPPAQVVVVHDELDLEPGRLRLKNGGGHGGHNGLRSIEQQLGSKDFLRIRVGIGKPQKHSGEPGAGSGADYVLSPFARDERPVMDQAVKSAADAAETILASGITAAMNDFNGVSPS